MGGIVSAISPEERPSAGFQESACTSQNRNGGNDV